ncbi:2-oxo acid dehydrogenase subunit E2 [bacterium endosymbiont of Pedicinus badii]|uniref:2-oxo acid dehydrogenase subunit E2 n=1 Tax=bacterium endosymbiont of Pedicinus badii TaxID=1719126 RepID=UPI0009BB7D54|nr:2-oxo acid dehydrogenase subunit E2 [bacterium endosymbiont of Pedicinus badii]OQM34230.1 hypothetical protein AOQ89_02760 [bacterium endosymbiont of Pedicinus badii]
MSTEVYLPDVGADSVKISEILVEVNDSVEKEQSIMVVESEKTSIEIPSPIAGIIKSIKFKVGEVVKSGSLLFLVEEKNTNNEEKKLEKIDIKKETTKKIFEEKKSKEEYFSKEKNQINNYFYASPSVRRLSRELDIDLEKIQGSGKNGRITKEDLINFLSNQRITTDSPRYLEDEKFLSFPKKLPKWPKISFENRKKESDTEEKDIQKIKKISGMNLHRNWIMIPHVTQFYEADITNLEDFRKEINLDSKKNKITILPFAIKAIVKALKKFPNFNSSFLEEKQMLLKKNFYNVGIAINTIEGLLVPVIKEVDRQDVSEISEEILQIIEKIKNHSLSSEYYKNGCITISNLGGIGNGGFFTPIINAPEVAILGVSRSFIKPIWEKNKFVPKNILPLSLSYDHRVIDGVEGLLFIEYFAKILENIKNLII